MLNKPESYIGPGADVTCAHDPRTTSLGPMTDADIDTTTTGARISSTTTTGLRRVIDATRRIAVLGIKIDPDQPAYFVPEYAQRAGFEIVPVPVYYPEVTEILGEPVYRTRQREFPATSTW